MDTTAEGNRMEWTMESHGTERAADGGIGYKPPALRVIGSVAELTLGCNKDWGDSDGYSFQGAPIACASP
jgi:hypothetical protein